MTAYELKSLKLPKLTGAGLSAFTAAVENPVSRALLLGGLLENAGIPKLRRITLQEPPTLFPLVQPERRVPGRSGVIRARRAAGKLRLPDSTRLCKSVS